MSPEDQIDRDRLDLEFPIDVEEINSRLPSGSYTPLEFESASDMLIAFEPDLQNGIRILYPWQLETLDFISSGKYTKDSPLFFNICAVNGSGKDAYVIAPLAVWHCACRIRSRFIITSASFKQLNTQTEPGIRRLCNEMNKLLGKKYFIIKRQHIYCPSTGSEIVLFVTDEEGNVEGYHPWADYAMAEMTICINEAKSVSENTFNALLRCTGFNRWIEVSSPKGKVGHFYETCTKAVQYPQPYDPDKRYCRRVTAYDCPGHVSQKFLEMMRLEMEDHLFRSIYLAEFTSETDTVVITGEKIEACRQEKLLVWNQKIEDLAGGLDLSLGGDETVLATRRGNKITYLDVWTIRDSNVLEYEISNKLRDRGYIKGETPVYVDVGGLGKPIYYHLCALGWNMVPIINNRAPNNKYLYLNGGTEDWFHLKELIVKKSIILPWNDDKFLMQLTTRKYGRKDNDKIKLESKGETIANGGKSPDRADAVVLAFVSYSAPERGDVSTYNNEQKKLAPNYHRVTQEELVEAMDNEKYNALHEQLTADRNQQKEYLRQNNQESWLDLMIKEHNRSMNGYD